MLQVNNSSQTSSSIRFVIMRGGGWAGGGGVDEESQKALFSSFKIGIRDVENDKYNQYCWMLQMKVVKRAN